MKSKTLTFAIGIVLLVELSTPFWLAAQAAMSERDARRLVTDSPWAKRSKLHSTASASSSVPAMEDPGTRPGGLGAVGAGHGWVPPTADQRISEMSGPQFVPCLGWGVGTMSHPSPTSDECKAAWKSLEVVKEGLPAGLVVIQWESAAPISCGAIDAGNQKLIHAARGCGHDFGDCTSVVARNQSIGANETHDPGWRDSPAQWKKQNRSY